MLGRRLFQLFLVALSCSILTLGCAQIRKATYPDNFIYLGQKQVSSKMAMLSLHMRQIDEILQDNFTISSEQQNRIIYILSSIDGIANELGAGNATTNHLVIDDHIDQFKSDVNTALFNVRADPPNYFMLGKLSGSCAACHQYRKF